MGEKCIVEIKEGERLYKTKLNALNEPVIREIICEPYTEPDLEQVRKEAYDKCRGDVEMLAHKLYSPKIDGAYQRGLNDAWDAARKISMSKINGGLSWEVMNDIFDTASSSKIYKTFTASEAIEKIRQYEQEKEKQEKLKKEQSVTAEDVMRQYLDAFCKGRICKGCLLNTPDFTCGRGYHFITSNPTSNEEVRRAYAKVLQKMREE